MERSMNMRYLDEYFISRILQILQNIRHVCHYIIRVQSHSINLRGFKPPKLPLYPPVVGLYIKNGSHSWVFDERRTNDTHWADDTAFSWDLMEHHSSIISSCSNRLHCIELLGYLWCFGRVPMGQTGTAWWTIGGLVMLRPFGIAFHIIFTRITRNIIFPVGPYTGTYHCRHH